MFTPVGPYSNLGRFMLSPGTAQGLGEMLLPSSTVASQGAYPRIQFGPATGFLPPGFYSPNVQMQSLCRQIASSAKEKCLNMKASVAHYGLFVSAGDPRADAERGLDLSCNRASLSPGDSPPQSSPLNFSIDSILGIKPKKEKISRDISGEEGKRLEALDWRLGASSETGKAEIEEEEDSKDGDILNNEHKYSWLQCTRYKPPKLPSEFTLNFD